MALFPEFGQEAISLDAARQQCILLTCIYGYTPVEFQEIIGPGNQILVWHVESGTWPPSYVLIKMGAGGHMLLIEGTTSINQGVTHVLGTAGRRFIDGTTLAQAVWLGVAEKMKAQIAAELPANWKTEPLRISGHSYGGGLAHYLGCMYRQEAPDAVSIQVMTFGEPRGLGPGYMGPQPHRHWRVRSTFDIVPSVPPESQIAYAAQWGMPLSWNVMTPAWQHYGAEVWLYASGSTTPEPNPVPLPPGVVEAIPDSHYLPNYWARLNRNAERFGGLFPTVGDIKAGNVALAKFPRISITPEMSNWLDGPDGRPTPIPNINVPNQLPEVNVGVCKVVWSFHGVNGETWSETYRKVVTAEPGNTEGALSQGLPVIGQALLNNRLNFLFKGHRLRSVRVTEEGGTKLTTMRIYNLRGNAFGTASQVDEDTPDDAGPDITSSSAVWTLMCANGRQRKVWFRGFSDLALKRNAADGFDELHANTLIQVKAFITAMAAAGYGCVFRSKAPEAGAGARVNISSWNGELSPGVSILTTASPHGLVGVQKIIIGGTNKKNLPGSTGIFKIWPDGLNTASIIYRTPSDGIVEVGTGYLRTYVPGELSPFIPGSSALSWLGSRDTKAPLSGSRGSQRAPRMRTLG